MTDDFVIKGRTLEHLVTFIICIAITILLGFFVLKYTNWFCDCDVQPDNICPKAGYVKATQVIQDIEEQEEEAEEIGTIDVGDMIDGITPEEPEEPINETPEEPEEEEKETVPLTGDVGLTIDTIGYDVKNPGTEMSFVKISNVTITLENGKFDFVPQVEVYLWDDENKELRNSNPDVYLFTYELEAGDKVIEFIDLSDGSKDLSLFDENEEKTTTKGLECLCCKDAQRTMLSLPCRHLSMCKDCSVEHFKEKNTCVLCQSEVKEVLNIFI